MWCKNTRPTIANIKNGESYTVYCGRSGRGLNGLFGNPFLVRDWGRGVALQKFRDWFASDDPVAIRYRQLVRDTIHPTDILGCFCAPQPCHCDVIADYVQNGFQLPLESFVTKE